MSIKDTNNNKQKTKSISVLALNDAKSFDGSSCYANVPSDCKTTGSGSVTIQYISPTTPPATTTTKNPNGASSSVYNFKHAICLFSLLFNIVYLI